MEEAPYQTKFPLLTLKAVINTSVLSSTNELISFANLSVNPFIYVFPPDNKIDFIKTLFKSISSFDIEENKKL